jgi:hypothetical protein
MSRNKKNQEEIQDMGLYFHKLGVWILMKFICNELNSILLESGDDLGLQPVFNPYDLEANPGRRLSEHKGELVINFKAYKQFGFEAEYALAILEEKLAGSSFISGVNMQIANLIDLNNGITSGEVLIQMYVNPSFSRDDLNC